MSAEKEELCRVLQSLACGKTRVIKKRPPGRDIDISDEFEFNRVIICLLICQKPKSLVVWVGET